MLAKDPDLVRKVRASISAKIKPTSLILYESPAEPWRLLDFQLIEAYEILDSEICPQCQHPIWLCRSKSPDLTWTTQVDVCQGTRAVDERNWRKNNKGKVPSNEDKAEWGTTIYPVPKMIEYPGEEPQPMPSREDFYKELQEANKVE